MTKKSKGMARSTGIVLASGLALGQIVGCAGVASRTPAEVAARAGGNDLRITWRGPESENPLFGFPVIERELEPINEKCRQQQGAPVQLRQPIRFAGPTLMKGQKPEFVRNVTTEIQCKQGESTLWAARISYADHRFYEDIQNRERIQLHLRITFLTADALIPKADPAAVQRRAEAEAAAKASREKYEAYQKRQAELKQVDEERRQALQAQLLAERPAFRAALQPGSRVQWIDHRTQSTGEPARGLVVEIKRPLALVQFDIPNGFGGSTAQTRWVPIDELGQP